jgi:predicted O-methyltransferase YrrM
MSKKMLKIINKINMINHNYKDLEGWFNMENQYLELLDNVPENGVFVELGAYKGKSTSFIVTEINNRNRNIKFHTIDTFEGDSGSNDEQEIKAYRNVNVSKMFDEFSENTKHLKEHFNVIVGKSDESSKFFEDNSVDVIFIDAGHSYDSVIQDIKSWLPKIKDGGIMSGHDYNSWSGVNKAVNEIFDKVDKIDNDCWFVKIKK